MKILYIVGPLATGILTYLQNLTSELSDKAEITIAYGSWPETPDHPETLFKSGIKFVHIPDLVRELNLKSDFYAMREIMAVVRDVNPDIIHLHSSKAGALGRAALSKRKYRLFYTPHGFSFLMDTSSAKKKLYHLIEKLLSCRATTIACSNSEYEIAKSLNSDCLCIDNGIDLERFGTPDSPCDTSKVYITGRVTEAKHPALFNEIAGLLPETEFTWIGAGPLENELTAPNIKITGWVTREEALTYAEGCGVYLMPSKWEGLSIALLEAMASSKLCIVSDIPGNRNAIENGKNGILCSTAEEYVEAIRNAGQYSELMNEARKTVEERFSTKRMAERYYEVYTGGYTSDSSYVSVYTRNHICDPAGYYRIGQYEQKNWKINDAVTENEFYTSHRKQGIARKLYQAILLIKIILRRTKQLNYDLKHNPSHIIVLRETVPRFMPYFLLSKLKRIAAGSVLIWDFDDDIRLFNECSLKEFNYLKSNAKHIIVTNNYLNNMVEGRATLLPTTDKSDIDIEEIIENRKRTFKDNFTAVWVGSSPTMNNLELVNIPGLHVVCNMPYEGDVENIPWTRETAKKEMLKAHLGIMPLKDEPYNYGKGAFKLIQYMSVGLPVMASSVGFNKEVVKPEFGFLDDFDTARLASDIELWERMSRASYDEYKRKYSYEKNLEFWRELLR